MFSEFASLHPFVQASIGGFIIGIASWLLLASIGRVAGISGIAASAVFDYDQGDQRWRWLFLLGLILGGGLVTILMPTSASESMPTNPIGVTVLAGLLVGFGTVVGSGCTSGHGVCGMGRRSWRSVIATAVFMATAMATTFALRFTAS